ncbi:MAG: hypothetical protein ACK4U0_09100 [Mesorhizobium sp.]
MSFRFWFAGWQHPQSDGLASVDLGASRQRWRLDVDRFRPGHVRIAVVVLSLLIWAALIGFAVWLW